MGGNGGKCTAGKQRKTQKKQPTLSLHQTKISRNGPQIYRQG